MNQTVEAEALYSADWWHSRTNEQLQELMRAGFTVGEAGPGAHRELERRAREHARGEEQQARLVAEQKKTLRLRILGSVLLAVLLALVVAMLMR
jgi:hypothetical protein